MSCRAVIVVLVRGLWAILIFAGPLWCQAAQCCCLPTNSRTVETRCAHCCLHETDDPVEPCRSRNGSDDCSCLCPDVVILFSDTVTPASDPGVAFRNPNPVASTTALLGHGQLAGDVIAAGPSGCLLCYQNMAVLR